MTAETLRIYRGESNNRPILPLAGERADIPGAGANLELFEVRNGMNPMNPWNLIQVAAPGGTQVHAERSGDSFSISIGDSTVSAHMVNSGRLVEYTVTDGIERGMRIPVVGLVKDVRGAYVVGSTIPAMVTIDASTIVQTPRGFVVVEHRDRTQSPLAGIPESMAGNTAVAGVLDRFRELGLKLKRDDLTGPASGDHGIDWQFMRWYRVEDARGMTRALVAFGTPNYDHPSCMVAAASFSMLGDHGLWHIAGDSAVGLPHIPHYVLKLDGQSIVGLGSPRDLEGDAPETLISSGSLNHQIWHDRVYQGPPIFFPDTHFEGGEKEVRVISS